MTAFAIICFVTAFYGWIKDEPNAYAISFVSGVFWIAIALSN